MDIKELSDRFKAKVVADASLNTYVFDDLSSINTNRTKTYPLLLMKPPNSTVTPFLDATNHSQWENYSIKFYVFDRWLKASKSTVPLETAYRDLEAIAENYLREVLDAGQSTSSKDFEYGIAGDKSVVKQRGHHQHNGQLIGISYEFTLRVYNSIC